MRSLTLSVLPIHLFSVVQKQVETMASALEGMCLTEHGWVRVYGSRCVRPPLIISDVARPRPVTVDAWQYAQSLTSKVGPNCSVQSVRPWCCVDPRLLVEPIGRIC